MATDIAVLVVAADDGVMPQTVEAINHAKAADVPIVVAINKIDREEADPNRVRQALSEHGLVPEEWGGDTIMVEVSALQNLGVDDILEQLLVVADIEELVANPEGRAQGVVLEAQLDKGRGPVATVLVDRGTLRVGDPMVAGAAWGRVRALIDDKGDNIKEASPSMPVQVLGLSDVPSAGDDFRVAPDDKTARVVAEARGQRFKKRDQRQLPSMHIGSGARLEDLFEQIQRGEQATLNLILKADVNGSLEALTESLKRLERDEVKLAFVHRAVGGITENDVQLASASNSTIIGFNVRPDRKSRDLAEREDVDIRTYQIIYGVLEDVEKAMVGLLKPEFEEVVTGEAEVREVFRVPRIGAVAGCYVRNGVITRNSKVRFLRGGRHHLDRHHHVAAPLQGRRPRGGLRLRVRHRPVRLPGPQGRRHHRDLRRAGNRTHVAVVQCELHIPTSRSLKEKRAVLRPIVEGLRHRFQISVAEVGYQDKWQRALVGMAVVSDSYAHAVDVVDNVERWVWSKPEVEVTRFESFEWVDAWRAERNASRPGWTG